VLRTDEAPDTAPGHGGARPRVTAREVLTLSPWVRLARKEVLLAGRSEAEAFHNLELADYVAVVARAPDGRIPLVRQFRPAVEAETLELPAGMVDDGEGAIVAAARELVEETGLRAGSLVALGSHWADTGRLANRSHVFYAGVTTVEAGFEAEPGVTVELVTTAELDARILDGSFAHQLHVAAYLLARRHEDAIAAATGRAW